MTHEAFMDLALEEGAKGKGKTSPNPPVGAILVRDGEIVGRGHHRVAGGPHAEAIALERAGALAQGADLYVTLEPCDHHGKTAPCAPSIVEAGVARVFVGTIDPNPKVSGRGIERLKRGGVEVTLGVREEACRELIEPWAHFLRHRRPYVRLKVAMSMDGRIATRSGKSQWITGEAAREWVHRQRGEVDAILVGRGTVEADDPRLTARLPGARDPLRVIVDSRLRSPADARVFRQESEAKTLVAYAGEADAGRVSALREAGAELVACEAGPDGRVDLDDLLRRLAERGVVDLLVEGGAEIFGAFLEAGRVDRLHLFMAPKVLGGGPAWTDAPAVDEMADVLGFSFRAPRLLGGDLLVEAVPDAKRAQKR